MPIFGTFLEAFSANPDHWGDYLDVQLQAWEVDFGHPKISGFLAILGHIWPIFGPFWGKSYTEVT